MATKVEISHRTILFTIFILLGIWLIYFIRDILFLIFVSFILMSALRPLVDSLVRLRIPRVLAIVCIYILVFGVFGVFLAGTIPSLLTQTTRLVQQFPEFISRLMPYWDVDFRSLAQQIAPISENVVKVTVGIFSNIVSTLTVLVFTFYFLLERRHTEVFLENIMGDEAAQRVINILSSVEKRLSSWVQGQLFLMIFIGVLSYIGLSILRVEFALPLAIIAGFLEIVPMIGPLVSAIPAVLVALAVSPFLALSVGALYFIIQQVENSIVVPMVMRRSVGLSPLVTIFALLVGGKLAGVAGAVLAVPIVLVIQSTAKIFLQGSEK
ncbi:MAG: AI-2E family transporter [bacterium]|nr:AI-2E family transporter [bacterium]